MICTLYSHKIGFESILESFLLHFPKAKIRIESQNGFQAAKIRMNTSFWETNQVIKIQYRQRSIFSDQLQDSDNCPLSKNLKGLKGYIASLPTSNENIKDIFLQKTSATNSEFSIIQKKGTTKGLKEFIRHIAKDFDAFIFAEPNALLNNTNLQHFLDSNFKLILDNHGNCNVSQLSVPNSPKEDLIISHSFAF